MIYNHRHGLGFPNDSQNEKIVIFVYSPQIPQMTAPVGRWKIIFCVWRFDGSCHYFANVKNHVPPRNARRSDNISIFSSRKSPCSFAQKKIWVKIRIFSTKNTTLGIFRAKNSRPKSPPGSARTLRKRHDKAMRICCFGCFTCGPWVEHKVPSGDVNIAMENHHF